MQSLAMIPLVGLLSACGSATLKADAGTDVDAPSSIDGAAPDIDAAGEPDAAPQIDAPAPTYTVGGTVSGFAGSGMVVQLNGGDDLPISADGEFTFSAALDEGTAYLVTVLSEPVCPQRFCTLENGDGTIASANINNVIITCVEPRYRLASLSWGDRAIRITDDLLALADDATATPRILVGNLTGIGYSDLDSVALDVSRDLVYAVIGAQVSVFTQAATTSGNLAPARSISVADETGLIGVELDEAADRLYVTASTSLHIFDNASTLSGEVLPTATIVLNEPATVTLDQHADRLFVGGNYTEQLWVFDSAGTLTSDSVADRTVTWTVGTTGFSGPPAIAVDGCTDRLYLGSNSFTPAGYYVVVFDNASALDGVTNLETDSQAQLLSPECISGKIDSGGRLYCWEDSPTAVWIYNTPESWSGVVTATPDKTIHGVVARGYGLDVVPY